MMAWASQRSTLVERHRRRLFRHSEIALHADVREGRARQQMDLAHHRADQPLDMARRNAAFAPADSRYRSRIPRQPRFNASDLELLGVVEVQPLRHALDRPFVLRCRAPSSQPSFVRAAWADAQRHRRRRGRLQRQMEARHASRVATSIAMRQPRPLDRLAASSLSTAITSTNVWSIWINASGQSAPSASLSPVR